MDMDAEDLRPDALTLSALTSRVGAALNYKPGLTGIWIVAETSDVRSAGGHCYMELLEKRADGTPLAKCRAVIWANVFARIGAEFAAATGQRLRSDMKIMARVNVSFHAVYGLALTITDLDASYTAGDLEARRRAILKRLAADGVADQNRRLTWPSVPANIAVISARGAAGYGDFVRHLHDNPRRLHFCTTLFEAAMQGERTPREVIEALNQILADEYAFDCVVIIRGGGAVADLAWFDDYALASAVAQYPLPVIVGIGHERDATVLDYIANTRVKTPTAAAEVLIGRMGAALDEVQAIGRDILDTMRNIISAHKEQLAYAQGALPAMTRAAVERNRRRCGAEAVEALRNAAKTVIERARRNTGIDTERLLSDASRRVVERRRTRLDALADMLDVLSPEATLRRGYSITRINGHAVTDSSILKPGDMISTVFARGDETISIVK